MSIENILQRIDQEAKSAAAGILEEARSEALRIQQRYAEQAAKLGDDLEQRARRKAQEEKRRLVVSEQLEIRKAVLARKREILEGLYEEAKGTVQVISGAEYLELIKSLILKNALSGREEIVVAGEHRGLFSAAYIASLNESFAGGGHFTLSKQAGAFSWGVVLREGRRAVDLTLDVLFEQLKERIESDVASILFPKR